MSDKTNAATPQEHHEHKEKSHDHAAEELKRQAEEYKSKYLRALADYQNLEKRMAGEREMLIQGAHKKLLERLLPFMDNLDRAEIFIKDESLKMIAFSFRQLLEQEGLKEIKVQGKEYDPYTAEVIDMVPGEKDNMVVEVLRKGYEFNGKILRVAQVKVSRKVPAEKGK